LAVGALPAGKSVVGKPQAYVPYQVVIANRLRTRPGNNDNVLGAPDEIRSQTDATDFAAAAQTVGGSAQPLPSPAVDPEGFFLLGPPGSDARDTIASPPKGAVPPQTPLLHTGNLQYTVTYGQGATRTPDDRAAGISVLLRRLANPHVPFDARPTLPSTGAAGGPVQANPWYNPYLTAEYLDPVPLRDATSPAARYDSWGKTQPYAADFSQARTQVAPASRQLTQHTFGLRNDPQPAGARYDWLVHLDRPLINPAELLHVAGTAPPSAPTRGRRQSLTRAPTCHSCRFGASLIRKNEGVGSR
jgi:hypothetical protein